MQTTAEAREPPRYVGHFLSRTAAVLQEREVLKWSDRLMNRQSRDARNHRRQEAQVMVTANSSSLVFFSLGGTNVSVNFQISSQVLQSQISRFKHAQVYLPSINVCF